MSKKPIAVEAKVSKIEKEVMAAYADCWCKEEDQDAAMKRRNLHFKAFAAVTRDEAISLLQKANPNSYNEFKASLLLCLPERAEVIIARESSVCVYVKGKLSEDYKEKLLAGEFCYYPETHTTRIWWD